MAQACVEALVEVAQGNFTTGRLVLTYLGEAGIVFAVLGLYAVQRPAIGRLGLYGALAATAETRDPEFTPKPSLYSS